MIANHQLDVPMIEEVNIVEVKVETPIETIVDQIINTIGQMVRSPREERQCQLQTKKNLEDDHDEYEYDYNEAR
jgi:hypothetical protein